MEQLELNATLREITGKKVKRLRREGLVPGIIYGHGVGSVPLKFDAHDLELLVSQAGGSTLVKIFVEGTDEPYTAIVRDVQRHILKRNVTHIDLQALSMTEKVRVDIPLILINPAEALEEMDAMLLQQLNEVAVECLPGDLVGSIEVDVSDMSEIGDSISLSDVTPPSGIEFLTPVDETVALISAIEEEVIEEEEEELLLEEPLEVGEVEVIGRGGEEEEEEFEEEEE